MTSAFLNKKETLEMHANDADELITNIFSVKY